MNNNLTSKTNVLLKIEQRKKLWIPILFSLLLLIISKLINFLEIGSNNWTNFELSLTQEGMILPATVGVVVVVSEYFLNNLCYSIYIYFGLKVFKYYLEFSTTWTLILYLSLITSAGELINTLIFSYMTKDYSTYISSFIDVNWVYESLLSPIELFNMWFLILIFIYLRKLANLPRSKTFILVLILVIWEIGINLFLNYLLSIF